MKTLQQFQCEFCNTVYKSEAECTACEIFHATPMTFVNMEYVNCKRNGLYPEFIDVKMSDSKIVRYWKT